MRLQLITTKQSVTFGDIRLVALEPLSMSHYLSLRESQEIKAIDEIEESQ